MKKKPIVAAIQAASLALAGTSFAGYAYGEETEAIEEVVVTGSRIQRAVSDAPSPITVINSEDLELSGFTNIADVLRNTTYNSFGSFRERSGTSFGQIALVDLRGMGPGRTAVLINGRRVPGNPFTGTSAVDINSIPLSAVERIEILTDSASAVYGSDALGGVINFIMKDDYEGAEVTVGGTRPSADGAESDTVQFLFGTAGDRGKVIASLEWFSRDAIFDKDRDYSAAQVNGPSFSDTVGVSVGGNTGFVPGFPFNPFPIGDCPTDLYAGVLTDPFGIPSNSGLSNGPSEGCGFGYADISAQTGAIERYSSFIDASYEINDNLTVYLENRYSRIESFGRYAPAVGFFFVDEGQRLANNLDPILNGRFFDAADTDGSGALEPGEGFFAFHRFVGHGPRDDDTNRDELDTVFGIEGTLFDDNVTFDAFVRHYFYAADELGNTYVLDSVIRDLAASGAYDVVNPASPSNAAAVTLSSADTFRDILTEFDQAAFSLTGSFGELDGGSIGWAVGAETAKETYEDLYDSYREAGNVIGTAGNSASGDRKRSAVFGEIALPVLDNLEINAAVRHDDYDDFGTNTSPSVSVRYEPFEWLVLRASYNEGFKAPDLTSLYQSRSQSFNNVTDFPRCEALGTAPVDCPTFQVENFTGGNPELGAEEAESTNFGVIITPIEGLQASFDFFTLDTTDRSTQLSLQRLLTLQQQGSLPSGTAVNRGPTVDGVPGTIISIDNVFANAASLDIEGWDMRVEYDADTPIGLFYGRLEWSHMESYEFQAEPGGAFSDFMDEAGYPEDRVNMNLRLTQDNWTVNYTMNYISSHGDGELQDYGSYNTHDILVEFRTPFLEGLSISLGVLNLTDEEPVLDSIGGYDDGITGVLYDLAGRRTVGRLKYTF